MKRVILLIVTFAVIVTTLSINVSATDIKKYTFDELIIERNIESPYTSETSKFSEGLSVKEEYHDTGEYIYLPTGEVLPTGEIKYGFIDKNNNEVIPCIYDDVSGINSNVNMESSRIGFYSFFESIVKTPGFYEGVATVKKGGKWGAIDKSGNVVIPFEFSELEAFNEGLAKAKSTNGKYGFIDKQGNIVVPMIYDNVGYFYNGYAKVEDKNTGKCGFINKTGNLVVPMVYDDVADFHEGLATVFNKTEDYYFGNYGFVNTQGQPVVPMIYNDAKDFSDGLAPIAIRDERFSKETGQKLYGYIDTNGNIVVQPKYSGASEFSEGLACVELNTSAIVSTDGADFNEPEMSGFIDTNGNEIIPLSTNYLNYGLDEGFIYGTMVVYKKDTDEYVRIKNPLAVSVMLNGNEITFDQPPIIINGRTLVPVRAIFEKLGASVEWYGDTETVVATRGGTTVKLTIDNNIMQKNGTDIPLDVSAQLINGRTLVPARAVAEAFGCKVDWNGDTQTVIINE